MADLDKNIIIIGGGASVQNEYFTFDNQKDHNKSVFYRLYTFWTTSPLSL